MARSDEQVDTVVIGAGQAGLCMSCFLQKKNLQHVVLERGRIGERWRSERWDTLRFQFESNIANLPGFPFAGEDKSTFMHRDDVVRILDNYAAFTRAPVRCGVEVNRLSRPADKPFQVRLKTVRLGIARKLITPLITRLGLRVERLNILSV